LQEYVTEPFVLAIKPENFILSYSAKDGNTYYLIGNNEGKNK
jgi:hypothetical protein